MYFPQWCQYNRSFDKYVDMIRRFDTKVFVYEQDNVEHFKIMTLMPNAYKKLDAITIEDGSKMDFKEKHDPCSEDG